MARYQSGSVSIHTTDLNSGTLRKLGGVTNMEVNTGSETIPEDSGSIYDESRCLRSQVPDMSITSKCVQEWLTFISLAGYCISADGSHPGIDLYARVLGDCKSPPASDANIRYRVATGLVILGELNAVRGQDATITIMIHPITDGTNAPFSGLYTGVTMPTSLETEQYTLGHCKVGNVVLSDLESMTIDFGVEITAKTPETGGIWPDSVAVRKVRPVATFKVFNPTILSDSYFPLAGKQASHAQTLIQLKHRANYSTFVADGTETHIALTMNGMATITQAFSGSGDEEANNVLRVEGVHDGTNVPIVIDTTAAYDSTP